MSTIYQSFLFCPFFFPVFIFQSFSSLPLVIVTEVLMWFFFSPFLVHRLNFFFTCYSDCLRVCNIHLQLIQVYFQVTSCYFPCKFIYLNLFLLWCFSFLYVEFLIPFSLKNFFFNWRIVDLQSCVSLCCIADWLSYTDMDVSKELVLTVLIRQICWQQIPQSLSRTSLAASGLSCSMGCQLRSFSAQA